MSTVASFPVIEALLRSEMPHSVASVALSLFTTPSCNVPILLDGTGEKCTMLTGWHVLQKRKIEDGGH